MEMTLNGKNKLYSGTNPCVYLVIRIGLGPGEIRFGLDGGMPREPQTRASKHIKPI